MKVAPDNLPLLKLSYLTCTTLQMNQSRTQLTHLLIISVSNSLCCEISLYRTSQLNRLMFVLTSAPVRPHKPLISIYIVFLIWHIIKNWSHVVIEEHSDVPVFQIDNISKSLYIQSIIGVLYSTVAYVWAQDITWDWMWCSSNRRKKKKPYCYRSLCHIYFIWFF